MEFLLTQRRKVFNKNKCEKLRAQMRFTQERGFSRDFRQKFEGI